MIFTSILSSSAAILLYTGLLFLNISIRKGDSAGSRTAGRSTYFIFALSSLCYGIHILFEIMTIQQDTIPGILLFFKPQVAVEIMAGIFWLWAIAHYTQVKPRRLLWLLTSIFSLLATLNLVLPYGYIWQEVSGLQSINLPWGESYVHLMGIPHPLIVLGTVTNILTFSFIFYACFRQYQQGEHQKASILAFCIVILLISTIHIYLVDAGVLPQFISTVPFTFLLMIILMSLQFADEIVKTELKLKYYNTHLEQIIEVRTQELKAAIQEATLLEERNRIAGELHDSVNQSLHSLVMIADSLPKIQQTFPEEIPPGLRKIKDLAQGTLAEMRNLLVELRPQGLVDKPLGELLRQLSQAIAHRTSLNLTTYIGCDSKLPPQVQICFYRIVQEALNNVVRHAKAQHAEIHFNCKHLDCHSDRVQLLVKDDGLGFSKENILPGNLGLNFMKERAEKIGACLKISSKPGQGTKVLVDWFISN